jgi:ubiquinone/menaquinone biosynthesis C-methylase UbiE
MNDSVVLDPAVELFDTGESGWALGHNALCTGLIVPPGEGLLDLLRELAQPRAMSALADEYGDRDLVEAIVRRLLERGFAHRAGEDLQASRERARCQAGLRDTLPVDLDMPGALEHALGVAARSEPPPALELTCARLAGHAEALSQLAGLRGSGQLRLHGVTVLTSNLEAPAGLLSQLLRLGAAIELLGLPWPHPATTPEWLPAAVAARLEVGVRLRVDAAALTPAAVDACAEWMERERISYVSLAPGGQIPPELLGGSAERLEERVCDVRLADLPADPIIVGSARAPARGAGSSFLRTHLGPHLKRRIRYLLAAEGRMTWAQHPAAEDVWLHPEDDFLASHPELLRLGPGKVVAELCAGLGRMGRRLARHVAPGGTLLGFEKEEFYMDRGRRFAAEGGYSGVQLRRGLAQRTPLPDASVDAAFMEWPGGVMRAGLTGKAVAEMARVLRPGGRLVVSARLCQVNLYALGEPPETRDVDSYRTLERAFEGTPLRQVLLKVWNFKQGMNGQPRLWFVERFVPRLVEPLAGQRYPELAPSVDQDATLGAEKPRTTAVDPKHQDPLPRGYHDRVAALVIPRQEEPIPLLETNRAAIGEVDGHRAFEHVARVRLGAEIRLMEVLAEFHQAKASAALLEPLHLHAGHRRLPVQSIERNPGLIHRGTVDSAPRPVKEPRLLG